MNRKNMLKLAHYLLGGRTKMRFDMEWFCDVAPDQYECGTVACAIGHGPAAGIALLEQEGWWEYAERALTTGFQETHWCFAYFWARVDNTPEGAAKRILWLLEYGVPKDWQAQMLGSAPLCYLDIDTTPEAFRRLGVMEADNV